ncbi:transposase, partial [Testudinibacter sp. TR-2022]|uniref:transposase n=2 Tax=Testudinibacter sp. TR-2022 TaxID=2585029 RepID=UPI00116BF59F
ITRHLYADAIDRANTRRLSEQGKVFYKRRAETVERSFADAKQHHNHRYARFRGVTKVQIQCFLAAMAQNIKKIALRVWALLRFILGKIALLNADSKPYKLHLI